MIKSIVTTNQGVSINDIMNTDFRTLFDVYYEPKKEKKAVDLAEFMKTVH